ncbi:hypothetical protein Tco_0358671, partial [Tanacetum coccineum]
ARTPLGPSPRRRPQCSDYVTPSSSSSVGMSCKRRRSPTTLVLAATHTLATLSPVRANMLPPRKRLRGSPSVYHYEVSIEDSTKMGYEDSMEADSEANVGVDIEADMDADIKTDIDTDIQADIEAYIMAEAVAPIEADVKPSIDADVEPV